MCRKCVDKLNCFNKSVCIPVAHKHGFMHANKAVDEFAVYILSMQELSQNKTHESYWLTHVINCYHYWDFVLFSLIVLLVPCCVQEIDELLGQDLTQQDEDAIAEELESILVVRKTLYRHVKIWSSWLHRQHHQVTASWPHLTPMFWPDCARLHQAI